MYLFRACATVKNCGGGRRREKGLNKTYLFGVADLAPLSCLLMASMESNPAAVISRRFYRTHKRPIVGQ